MPSLVEIGPVVLEKKFFFLFLLIYFHYYRPLEKGRAMHLNKLTQGCFVPSLVEIGHVVLEKKIFLFRLCIFAISLLSPLEKGQDPSFEQTCMIFTQTCFVPSLVEIGLVVLEKKMKM